jgi:hypothetical protein
MSNNMNTKKVTSSGICVPLILNGRENFKPAEQYKDIFGDDEYIIIPNNE